MKMYIRTRVQRKKQAYTFSNYTLSNVKTLFALQVTNKEKRPSHMLVNLKKTKFAPVGVQAGSSSCTFHPEATGAGGKVQSKKTIPVETQTLTFTNWLESLSLILFGNSHNGKERIERLQVYCMEPHCGYFTIFPQLD